MGRLLAIEGACLYRGAITHRRVTLRDGRIDLGTAECPAADSIWKLPAEAFLIPAFHDHHTHLIGHYRPPQGPDLGRCMSRRACFEEVERWILSHPDVRSVVGEGWDESAWEDRRPPTRDDLDRLALGKPVALRRVCGHMAVVNTAMWEVIRPTGAEADPISGTLTETLALGLPARWPPTSEDLVEGARRGQSACAQAGVVAVDEMARLEQWHAFRALEERGGIWLRVRHAFPIDALDDLLSEGIAAGSGGECVRAVGLKGFLDGSFGARTAAVVEPYVDCETTGMLLWDDDRLRDAVRNGAEAGFAIRLHAIGRRAIDQAIRALDGAPQAVTGEPHRIEHAEEADSELIARAARAGIAFSMQPNFTARWQQPGGMYDRALGHARARLLNPYRSVAGKVPLLFGSDTMPFGPLIGLPGATAHPNPDERLSPVEAIRAYAAGSIEDGMPGDLVVLRLPNSDLQSALAEGKARVIFTAAGGKTVFSDADAAIPDLFREGRA
jgi:predicted amidohydrolase YtcJ